MSDQLSQGFSSSAMSSVEQQILRLRVAQTVRLVSASLSKEMATCLQEVQLMPPKQRKLSSISRLYSPPQIILELTKCRMSLVQRILGPQYFLSILLKAVLRQSLWLQELISPLRQVIERCAYSSAIWLRQWWKNSKTKRSSRQSQLMPSLMEMWFYGAIEKIVVMNFIFPSTCICRILSLRLLISVYCYNTKLTTVGSAIYYIYFCIIAHASSRPKETPSSPFKQLSPFP